MVTMFVFSMGNVAKIVNSLALSYYGRFQDPMFRPKIEEKCPCLRKKIVDNLLDQDSFGEG